MSTAALEAIYARIPEVDCRRQCIGACGPIALTEYEAKRIRFVVGGPLPPLQDHPIAGPMVCGLLTPEGRCSVYATRPLICRIYGAVERLRCPFGCEPERWLSDAEAEEMLREILLLEPGAREMALNCTAEDFQASIIIGRMRGLS